MRAFDLAASVPWVLPSERLQTILEIAARENLSPEAVAEKLGRPLDNTREVTIRDGVATIPITGPIFHRANLFTEVSGATSIEVLATDLRTALDDPAVSAILLDVDSPGGEVAGISEFADMVYTARAGPKPIDAYVPDEALSGGYWIASAARRIIVADTAVLGSIGAVVAVPDPEKRSARTVEFVSSQSPNKRPDPTTERGKNQLQGLVDALGDVFVSAVARNRGVSVETVLADFGQGGLLVGQAAVDVGLADATGSYEQALSDLASEARDQQWPGLLSRPAARATDTGGRQVMAGEKQAGTEQAGAAQASEVEQLRAELAREREASAKAAGEAAASRAAAATERKARIEAEAKAFAREQIAAGRAMVADEEKIVSALTLAASDEATPDQRAASVKALVSGRAPGVHLKELVGDPELVALGAKQVTDTGTASDIEKSREAGRKYAEQLNGKKRG